MNYLIFCMTKFRQELKVGHMKDQIEIFIQCYNMNVCFQKPLLLCRNSSYFPLPKKLRNTMKGLINIQNDDDECFKWWLVRYLNHVNKNSAKIWNFDEELAKQLTFKVVNFLVHKRNYAKMVKRNNIFIGVSRYEGKTSHQIYTSKQTLNWNSEQTENWKLRFNKLKF